MRLLFVRHGESRWNVEGRFQGRRDIELSELGVKQAHALAARLAAHGRPAAIVASPLVRARRTAEIVGQACGRAVDVDERLVEISHGEWEGLVEHDVAQRWPAMIAAWHEKPHTVSFPDGESLDEVQTRFRSFATDVAARPSPLLVCTHDVIVRLAALWASGEPIERFFSIMSENGAITEIELEAGSRPRLVRLNDSEHLSGLRSDLARQAL